MKKYQGAHSFKSVHEGRNFKGKSEIISSTFSSSSSVLEKGNHHAKHGGFSLGLSLQQRHTICIGARRDHYNSSLQGVDRFTVVLEVDTEHGLLISALLRCGIQLLLGSGQLCPKVSEPLRDLPNSDLRDHHKQCPRTSR